MLRAQNRILEESVRDGTIKPKPVTPAYNAKSAKPTATIEDYYLDPKLLNDPKALLDFAQTVDHSDPGYLSAAFLVGYGYKEGRFGFEVNEAEAEKWLKIARIDDKPYGDGHPATVCARAIRTLFEPEFDPESQQTELVDRVVAEKYLPALFLECITRQKMAAVNPELNDKKSQEETIKRILRLVEKGFVPAVTLLGECYFYGRDITENKEEALILLRKAAELGDTPARNFINEHYKKEANKCCVM